MVKKIIFFENGVEGSIGESRSNSMSEKINEENIVEADDEENFEQNKEEYN
jgi:hypothetical protein